jgi:putative spermidine/putrescine transport system substrate-binding protein
VGSGELNQYSTGGAVEEFTTSEIDDPFTAETGIKINRVPGPSTSALIADIESGANVFDAFAIAASELTGLAEKGWLAPIDYQYWDPADRAGFAPVPASEYGVPSIIFATVVAYDPNVFTGETPANWADMWDTTKFPGGRSIYPGSWGEFGPFPECALLADGIAPEDLYPCDLDRAFASMDRIKSSVTKYSESGIEPVQLIADGNASVVGVYNGRVQGRIDEGGVVAYTWDQALVTYDVYVVPAEAKNKENAFKYLAWRARPENQAKMAEFASYSPTNSRALELVKPDRAILLPTAPENGPKTILRDADWWAENGTEVITRWEEWIAAG